MPDKTAASTYAHMCPDGSAKDMRNAYRTRPKRRKALDRIILELKAIMAAEKRYVDNAPLSQQITYKYETAELNVGMLGEVLEILSDLF
jgi:hypothetical protein